MDWPTIIVAAIVFALFLFVIIRGIQKKRRGEGGCSCGCSACAMRDSCHAGKKES